MAAASAGAVQQAAIAVSVAGPVEQQQQQQHQKQHQMEQTLSQQQQQQHHIQSHSQQQSLLQHPSNPANHHHLPQHQLQQSQQHIQHQAIVAQQRQHQLLQHQQQQQQQQQHHSLRSQPHHNVHYQPIGQNPGTVLANSAHQQHPQRFPFMPQVGNGLPSNQIKNGSATTGVYGNIAAAEVQQQAALMSSQQQQHAIAVASMTTKQPTATTNQMAQMRHQQKQNPQQQHQQHQVVQQPPTTIAANLAPGWRRLLANNEIVYVSPSGATLRSHSQIKDYLLSPNTCKCGLPCPLRPEYFFDFNSQVPTMLLQIPLENGFPARSSLVCNHQRKYFESQQNIMHKEFKRRKINDLSLLPVSGSGKISTSPASECDTVTVYSGNVMQTSQLVKNNANNSSVVGANGVRLQMLGSQQPGAVSNIAYQQSGQTAASHSSQQPSLKQELENEKVIGSVALSKTPPWRKNSILQQQQQTGTPSQHQIYAPAKTEQRIPPLPQSHLQNATPPWQHQQSAGPPQHASVELPSRPGKNRQSPGVALPSTGKKKPNFKDDPTGYLDHQTAILHNSILNVVHSPDLNETPPPVSDMGDDNLSQSEKDELADDESDMSTTRNIEQHRSPSTSSVIQQNQNLYPRNNLQTSIESKAQQSAITKHPNFMYQPQNQPRMPTPQLSDKSHVIHTSHPHSQQLLANVPSSQHQPQPTFSQQSQNVPQPYLVEKHQSNQNASPAGQNLVRNAHFLSEADQQQATTTTIGGQTVTHFPNGMVQVEQNCDSNNGMVPLKPQQHVQLQQQIHQHNLLYRHSQQISQKVSGAPLNTTPTSSSSSSSGSDLKVGAPRDSPVSSSTSFSQSGTESSRSALDGKGPAQVGAVSTSIESPITCPSPADSESTSSTIKSVPSPAPQVTFRSQPQASAYGSQQTTSRNTITSVQAGRTITVTTTSTTSEKSTREIQYHSQKLSPSQLIPVSTALSGIQLQPTMREPGSQLIMTSSGQLIVMPGPAQASKPAASQVLISSPSNGNLVHQQSVAVINQQGGVVNSVDVSNSTTNHIIQNSPNGLMIQNTTTGLVQPATNMLQQAGTNLISQNGQNFIVNSATANGMQSMLLNNSNLIQQGGQNLNLIQTASNGAKVISGATNLINQSGNLISPNASGLIGQQTVVLNTLPNGYVIQPNFTTVDGQMVSQIMNQNDSNSAFLQQQQTRQIILTSPDSKRRAKKRKSSSSSSPSTPSSLSPQQSPTTLHHPQHPQQHSSSMVQITSQYPSQGFQISPGIQGIVMNKSAQAAAPQQQIIFQNGQLIQPMNIIGQQLLVPAGLVVAPDTTLLQIQNIGACGNIITPQGMVLRAPSPQNKSFLSPSGPAGQQFIVSGNNHQVNSIGQIYGAPVSLVVPQSNGAGATTTFVQQNATIVQQQQQHHHHTTSAGQLGGSGSTSMQDQGLNHGTASPPDTTTHSPRSPERPPSERSGGSDMVQCVSSSEPDSVVSPVAADSAQSPSTTDYDRGNNISYQSNNSNMYKPTDAKIRRVETPPQYSTNSATTTIIQESSNQMPPDSHESASNSPRASSASSSSPAAMSSSARRGGAGAVGSSGTSMIATLNAGAGLTGASTNIPGSSSPNNNSSSAYNLNMIKPSFSIGQLVWGAARGHPAWPGKIVNPPDGIASCTPSDSTWVQWFGGRSNPELVGIFSLKTLSEGLEAHHKAQKDTRKSRKLNQQLERAIQEAMTELDRISAMAQPTSTTTAQQSSAIATPTTPTTKVKSRGRQPMTNSSSMGHQRTKPIKIAPAPPVATSVSMQQKQQPPPQQQQIQSSPSSRQQTSTSVLHHQQIHHHTQHQHPHSATQTSK